MGMRRISQVDNVNKIGYTIWRLRLPNHKALIINNDRKGMEDAT